MVHRLASVVVPMLLVLLPGFATVVHAQTDAPDDLPPGTLLNLYLDCRDIVCDHEFIRAELLFVPYVRDRRDADVYVLVTRQPTAAGGSEATLEFIGQQSFSGLDDTLRFTTAPAESADQVRQSLVRGVQRGSFDTSVGRRWRTRSRFATHRRRRRRRHS